jgi:hypothetical protein
MRAYKLKTRLFYNLHNDVHAAMVSTMTLAGVASISGKEDVSGFRFSRAYQF